MCSAQDKMQITGTVINGKNKMPLEGASIYLSNTTIGAISSDSGTFSLKDISAGKYDLVVSYLGYKTKVISINEQSNLNGIEITLYPAAKQLQEVVVNANTHWNEEYNLFLMSFIGRDENASHCKIINPKVLSFQYVDSVRVFSAGAEEPLVIVNNALGYKIHYQLEFFTRKDNHVSYFGYSHFELMRPKSNNEEKRWEKSRRQAYYGSLTHFMRSLLRKSLEADGFVVKKLIKSDDSLVGHPVLYRWTGEEYKITDTTVVSRSEWNKRSGFNILYPGDVKYDSIINPIQVGAYHQLAFTHSLYVIYTRDKGSLNFFWGYMPDKYRHVFLASIVTMKIPSVSVDNNGNMVDPLAVTTEGYWATQRIADMLPLDYLP